MVIILLCSLIMYENTTIILCNYQNLHKLIKILTGKKTGVSVLSESTCIHIIHVLHVYLYTSLYTLVLRRYVFNNIV